MKIEDVAIKWKISLRSAYRLASEGVLPTSTVVVTKPMTRLDVDDVLVEKVASQIPAGERVTVGRIKFILGGLNVKKPEANR